MFCVNAAERVEYLACTSKKKVKQKYNSHCITIGGHLYQFNFEFTKVCYTKTRHAKS